MGLKRHPVIDGKEATFWHLTSEGKVEEERTPDIGRCERIGWVRSVIEHAHENCIRVWSEPRRAESRVHLWLVPENYVVVVAERAEYCLPWTAFLAKSERQKQALARRFKEYR